jgi:NAD(P)-dependent dehydrogenase (short-subunit alcohol dehydrogenase family)
MDRAAYEKQELARAGLRRYSQPEDIANLVAFLASGVAEQIHGVDVFIDGGATKTIL